MYYHGSGYGRVVRIFNAKRVGVGIFCKMEWESWTCNQRHQHEIPEIEWYFVMEISCFCATFI